MNRIRKRNENNSIGTRINHAERKTQTGVSVQPETYVPARLDVGTIAVSTLCSDNSTVRTIESTKAPMRDTSATRFDELYRTRTQ